MKYGYFDDKRREYVITDAANAEPLDQLSRLRAVLFVVFADWRRILLLP